MGRSSGRGETFDFALQQRLEWSASAVEQLCRHGQSQIAAAYICCESQQQAGGAEGGGRRLLEGLMAAGGRWAGPQVEKVAFATSWLLLKVGS